MSLNHIFIDICDIGYIESWSELVNCQPMTALVLIIILFQRHHLQGYYYKANVQTLPPPYPPNVARRQGRKRETRREVRRILDISEVLVFVAWSRGAGEYLSWHSQGMLSHRRLHKAGS